MQVVFWTMWKKTDGKFLVGYHLGSGSKTKFLYNLSKEEILQKYYNENKT